MKRLLSLVAFFATLQASAQQVNPVPDYVFRNQMSVGRGTVTDTAAYFSIGPRYGATKGFMPPIVGDTATFSSGKRNGLLIFSVQKNKFLYWDSVRVQWSDMAGSSGAYIVAGDTSAMLAPYLRKADTTSMLTAYLRKGDTSSMLSPYYRSATASAALALKLNISDTSSMLANYIRHAGYGLTKSGQSFLVDTLNIATRAWRQKGIDSVVSLIPAAGVSGSGTTNYVPKFTAASTIGNSQIFDNGTRVGIGTASPAAKIDVRGTGTQDVYLISTTATNVENSVQSYFNNGGAWADLSTKSQNLIFNTGPSGGPQTERLRITSDGDILHRGTYNPLSAANRGNIMLNGSASNIIGFSNNSALRGYIFHTDSDFQFYNNTTGGRVGLYTEGTARLWIQANGRIGINTTTDAGYQLDINGTLRSVNGANFATTSGSVGIGLETVTAGYKMQVDGNPVLLTRPSTANNTTQSMLVMQAGADATLGPIGGGISLRTSASGARRWMELSAGDNADFRNIYFPRANVGIGDTSASYKLDVTGTLRSTLGANFATTSGQVGIGKTSPSAKSKLDVEGNIDIADGSFYYLRNAVANTGTYGMYYSNSAPKYPIRLAVNADPTNNRFFEIGWHKNDNKDSTWNPTFSVNSYNAETFINTTTDAGDYKLQVSGNILANVIYTRNNTDALIFGTNSAVNPYIQGGSNNHLYFGTSNTPRLQITTDGELLVNTSTDAGDYKLQVSGNIYNTGSAVLAATSGNVGLGITIPQRKLHIQTPDGTASQIQIGQTNQRDYYIGIPASQTYFDFFDASAGASRMRLNSAGELILDASGTDAGDYKLQVVGNARIGTGKLDIASNTTFGIGVARSGTSEVAGQIYNSNGILYLGAESSAGGQIFSGSSAYAAVIGSGANYPLQFAANNITRATLTSNGNFMIGFPTDTYFYRLQVNGSIFSNNQIIAQNAAAQLNIDSSTNISPLYISNQSLTGSSAQGLFYGSTTWNTTGNPSLIDLAITNTASGATSNYIKISDGSNIFRVTKAAEVVTAAPTGGSIRKWKLGEAATVSPTSPNRTIRVEIDGTVYYLHAKTTND